MKRLFWKFYYLFISHPTDLLKYLKMIERTSLSKTFNPNVFYNTDGKQWHIHFTNEMSYVRLGSIKAEIHVGEDSGNIVGLTIFDETLAKPTISN